MSTLLVSPHSDDIAIAAGHLVVSNYMPKPLHLITIFSISNWVEPSWVINVNDRAITQIRLKEDQEFCTLIDAKFHTGNLEDCAMRYGTALFEPEIPIDLEIVTTIQNKLEAVIREERIKVIVVQFPHGSQQHLDHRMVCSATSFVSLQHNLELIFIDDLPYSRIPISTTVCHPNGNSMIPNIVKLSDKDLMQKHEKMRIYASQMCEEYFDSTTMHLLPEHPYNSESFWR